MQPEGVAHLAKQIAATIRGDSDDGAVPLAEQRAWLDEVLRQVAEELETANQPIVCSSAGCNGCCRGAVPMSDTEWEVLLPLVTNEAWERVAARRSELSDPDRERTAVCPLIDPESGGCSVYRERPMTCRAYHSVAPTPDLCFPDRVGQQFVPSHPIPQAAAVALMIVVKECGEEIDTLAVRLVREAERR